MRKKLLWPFFITLSIFSILNVNMLGVTAAETHDIAVISVTPLPTSVEAGKIVSITVIINNTGAENETFDVTAYYDTTAIGTQTNIALEAGANTSLTFTWDTTDVAAGTYEIKAKAGPVPNETNVGDNTLISPSRVRVFKSPYIGVIPHSTVDLTLTPGKNYIVSIYTDYNGTDIWGYEFFLSYNPLVLNGINVTNGDLIVNGTGGKDTGARFTPGTFDKTLGKLSLTTAYFDYLTPPPNVTSGPGILANVAFEVVGEGDSDIKLGTSPAKQEFTRLRGYDKAKGREYFIIDDITPKPGHILHGYFRNVEAIIHDVAVVSVTPLPTNVTAGEEVNITVVVKNNGTVLESFEVTVDCGYDTTWFPIQPINTKLVEALEAGAHRSLIFTWDTTPCAPQNYAIKAVAAQVPGEENLEDNTRLSSEPVIVRATPEKPIPIELIIGIAVVVVVVVAAVTIYVVRRRKKRAPQ